MILLLLFYFILFHWWYVCVFQTMAPAVSSAASPRGRLTAPAFKGSRWGQMDTRVKVSAGCCRKKKRTNLKAMCASLQPGESVKQQPWSCRQRISRTHSPEKMRRAWSPRQSSGAICPENGTHFNWRRSFMEEDNAGLMMLNNASTDWEPWLHASAAALANQSQLPGCSTRYGVKTAHVCSEVDVVQQRHLWQLSTPPFIVVSVVCLCRRATLGLKTGFDH